MRRRLAVPLAILSLVFLTAQSPAPDDLLQRGRDSYRSGHYADAIKNLSAAADAFLSPAQVHAYVTTGQLPSLDKFETAIIYLALSYSKMGKDADAAEQIRRLNAAEAIAPTFSKLALADIADFQAVAKRVAPGTPVPTSVATAVTAPTPAPQPAAPAAIATAQREADQRVAAARATAEQEAQQRIDTERAAIQKAADEKIAAEREAIRKEADRVIAEARAAAEREMQEKIAAERAAMQKTIEERIASERAALERETQERIAADRLAAQRQFESNPFTVLRRAEALASSGQVDEANTTYLRLLNAPDVSRDTVAAVATGLYRTGDYRNALRALQKIGTFLRGEEDLRFYKAVALYETGSYSEAKKELACALPYIQMTDDVSRYRVKIEQTTP